MNVDVHDQKSFRSVRIGVSSVALFLVVLLNGTACDQGGTPTAQNAQKEEVVLYTSVDEPVARPILSEFTRRTGIDVRYVGDVFADKGQGLVERLEGEKAHPKADVWWGNEAFRTIRLADAGVLAAYESPSAKDIPPQFKDPSHRWAGSALRARVIGVCTDRRKLSIDPVPSRSILDLLRPELKGRIAIANPRVGTVSGHVAALYVLWGDQKADQFFRDLRANGVEVLRDNGAVAFEVAKGTVWAGLTDNDDVEAMILPGADMRGVVPDQDSFGTLTIPCTTGLIAGSKRPDDARKLIDYLLSPEVEQRLIERKYAACSVRPGAGPTPVKSMKVDYFEVAKALPRATDAAEAILVGPR